MSSYDVRQWALDKALELNDHNEGLGVSVEKIVADAEQIFLWVTKPRSPT